MRVQLKGIHKVTKKLADGGTATYFYAWRGGPRIEAEPGTEAFVTAFTAAHQQRKTPSRNSLSFLVAKFKGSAEYLTLEPPSRKAYSRYLDMILDAFGDMPIAALKDPEVRGEFKDWRDRMAGKPRTADYAWTTLARVLSVAKDRGLIPVNPCEKGGRLYEADRTDKFWGEAELGAVLSLAGPQITLALILALWTGQRQGDLLRLPWSAYDGKKIRLRQSKGGRRVVIPVGPTLRAELDATKRAGPLILTNTRGQPWTSDGFRTSWGKLCARAKIEGLTFHDLRGSAVVRLALAGCTVPEIATITGHGLKDVEAILDAHYLGRDVRLAENAIRKLERKEKRTKAVNRAVNRP